jgi:hypothetical protein
VKTSVEPVYLSLTEYNALIRLLKDLDEQPQDEQVLAKVTRKVVAARNTVRNRLGVPK